MLWTVDIKILKTLRTLQHSFYMCTSLFNWFTNDVKEWMLWIQNSIRILSISTFMWWKKHCMLQVMLSLVFHYLLVLISKTGPEWARVPLIILIIINFKVRSIITYANSLIHLSFSCAYSITFTEVLYLKDLCDMQ